MSKIIYQNENAVLNHLGVRKLVTISATAHIEGRFYGTPAEVKEEVRSLKEAGATNIKVK